MRACLQEIAAHASGVAAMFIAILLFVKAPSGAPSAGEFPAVGRDAAS